MFKIPVNSSDSLSINWKDLPCSRINLPLYRENGNNEALPCYTDVIQGEIGSCWFLSALISYLRPNGKILNDRSLDIVKFINLHRKDPNRDIYKITMYGKELYVDDYIPQRNMNVKCMWFILLEKAMLSLMTFFKNSDNCSVYGKDIWVKNIEIRHGEMKAATTGIGYVVGGKTKYYALHKCDIDQKFDLGHITSLELYSRFKDGHHILANTHRMTYPGKKYPNKEQVCEAGAAGSHCYAIIDFVYSKEKNTYLLTICNPWGRKEICEEKGKFIYPEGVAPGKGISVITWEKFHHLFACVHTSV